MGSVAQVLRVDPVGELSDAGHKLRGDLDVVPVDLVEGPDPEPGPELDQDELLLPERSDHAGDEGALGRTAVQLREKLCLHVPPAPCLPEPGFLLRILRLRLLLRGVGLSSVLLLQFPDVGVGVSVPIHLNKSTFKNIYSLENTCLKSLNPLQNWRLWHGLPHVDEIGPSNALPRTLFSIGKSRITHYH